MPPDAQDSRLLLSLHDKGFDRHAAHFMRLRRPCRLTTRLFLIWHDIHRFDMAWRASISLRWRQREAAAFAPKSSRCTPHFRYRAS